MTKLAFKIEIHPVNIKRFNNEGSIIQKPNHYIGFIHGISNLKLKNLYMNNNRQTMIDEMFNTIKKAKLIAA